MTVPARRSGRSCAGPACRPPPSAGGGGSHDHSPTAVRPRIPFSYPSNTNPKTFQKRDQEAMTVIGVVGAGVMGVGVAQNLASTGHDVVLVDVSEEILAEAVATIRHNCRMSRLLGGPALDAEEVLSRITTGIGADSVAKADIIIENVPEDWDIKRQVFAELDAACDENTVFVVNTSAIPITKVATVTGRPDKVIGVHFMNPVPMKPAVELIPGFHTSAETVERTRNL